MNSSLLLYAGTASRVLKQKSNCFLSNFQIDTNILFLNNFLKSIKKMRKSDCFNHMYQPLYTVQTPDKNSHFLTRIQYHGVNILGKKTLKSDLFSVLQRNVTLTLSDYQYNFLKYKKIFNDIILFSVLI